MPSRFASTHPSITAFGNQRLSKSFHASAACTSSGLTGLPGPAGIMLLANPTNAAGWGGPGGFREKRERREYGL
jgi:hypothetical protein